MIINNLFKIKGEVYMRKIAVVLILIPSLLLTGCWNAREINELGFVLSIALDKTDYGFKVTAQIADPETFSKTPSGSVSTQNKPFWIISSTGKTIFEAIRNMASISSRRIFWAHIKVIIISEKLARSDTLEIFDFFARNPELRLRTLIAVTPEEDAGKLIEIVPEMEQDPALYLEKIIETENLTGKSYSIMLKDFLEDYLNPNVGPVTSRIVLDKSKSHSIVKTSGAYVFDTNKVVVSLNEEETRGLLWIKNRMKDSIMVVNCPEDNMLVTLEIKDAKSSYESYLDKGIPHFVINLKVNASIVEQSCCTDFNKNQKLNELSKSLEKAVYKDIQSIITIAKDSHIDFLSLSRILHRQHKEEWHQLSSNWKNIFTSSDVDIVVKADINHVSLAKPLEPIKMNK